MPIVTLSHEIGAGGPEIGQTLAERLSLHYVDQELISQAALRYGLLEEKLSSLDESKPSLLERFDAETRRALRRVRHRAGGGLRPVLIHDPDRMRLIRPIDSEVVAHVSTSFWVLHSEPRSGNGEVSLIPALRGATFS
jgi:hypothetical protein